MNNYLPIAAFLHLILLNCECNSFLLNGRLSVLSVPCSSLKNPLLPQEYTKAERLCASYRPNEMDEESVTSEDSFPYLEKHPHYESEGSIFDITSGPGHHLIDVDSEKLKEVLVEKSVNVNEITVDPISITAVTFLTLALLIFVIVFFDDMGLSSLIANIQNRLSI